MGKQYSKEFKNQVLNDYKSGNYGGYPQVAKKYGIKFRAIPKSDVSEGIDLVRRLLLKVTFDGSKCLQGIRALKEYHKDWDEKNQQFKDTPCHDWSSHGADAFRYLCQAIIAFIDNRAAAISKLLPEADHNYNPLREKAIKLEMRELKKIKSPNSIRNKQKDKTQYYANLDYDIFKF